MCLIKQGRLYYYDTTILTFGFGPNEREALKEAANDQIIIFQAENWVDIIAVPYRIGIVNYKKLRYEEQETITDFFKSYGNIPETIVYAVNCPIPKAYLPRGFVPCNSIFRNQSTLKSSIMTALKNQKRIGPVESFKRRLH